MVSSVLVYLLQQDNEWPHKAHAAAQQITDSHLGCLPHSSCSRNLTLAPCDYSMFGHLEQAIGRKKTIKDEKVLLSWLQGQSEHFFFLQESRQ